MRFLRKIFFLFFLTSLVTSCNIIRSVVDVDRAGKIEKQMIKEEMSANEAAKQKHIDMQSERTKEMMKRTKKRSRKINRKKKEAFWKKILGL